MKLLPPLLGFVSVTFATTDPNYTSSFPFRPRNVTGLTELYAWVGSYYNATTTVELMPQFMEQNSSPSECSSLMNKTYTSQFESFLAITERSPQNIGSNPVNLLLTLWKPGFNFSSLSFEPSSGLCLSNTACTKRERERLYGGLESAEWVFESAPWTLAPSDDRVEDNLNLTSASIRPGQFNLTGTVEEYNNSVINHDPKLTLNMEPCSSAPDTKLFTTFFVSDEIPIDINSHQTAATVGITFDAQSANLTVSGNFAAFPFDSPSSPVVRGKIIISFAGVLDPYHSDVLMNTSSSPVWMRTVGFANNSLNIGFGESGSRSSLYSMSWLLLVATLILCSCQLGI